MIRNGIFTWKAILPSLGWFVLGCIGLHRSRNQICVDLKLVQAQDAAPFGHWAQALGTLIYVRRSKENTAANRRKQSLANWVSGETKDAQTVTD